MLMDTPSPLQPLLPLFHHAPMAMAETDAQGAIRQLNPKAIQLMMPMATYLGLPGDNLLDTLAGLAPSIRQTVADFGADSGLIFDQEPYCIEFNVGSVQIERFFSLTIDKQAPGSLLIFFDDVTDFLIKADKLRQRL